MIKQESYNHDRTFQYMTDNLKQTENDLQQVDLRLNLLKTELEQLEDRLRKLGKKTIIK